jgi:hypothetical protein
MNQIKKIIVLLFIAISCSSNIKKAENQSEREDVNETGVAVSDGTLPVVKIRRPSGELPMLRLSEIAKDIKYIKLETHDDALLFYPFVFQSDESNYMFIVCRRQIYKFDRTGKFIKRIGRPGQGPGEFVAQHVQVDFQKKLIYVYPGSPGYEHDCILKLDFDGKILERIKNELVTYPEKMALLNDQFIMVNDPLSPDIKWSKNGYMQLYSFNPNLSTIVFGLPNLWLEDLKDRKFSLHSHTGKITFAARKEMAFYKYILNDTVYKISDGGAKPFFILDMGKKPSLEDYLGKVDLKNLFADKLLIYTSMVFKNHILLWFTKGAFGAVGAKRDLFLCLYDIKTGKLSYHDFYILNDLDGGPNFDGFFYSYDPSVFKKPDEEIRDSYYKGHDGLKVKFPERKDEFKKLMDMSDEEDNPIIQIISFKDDF